MFVVFLRKKHRDNQHSSEKDYRRKLTAQVKTPLQRSLFSNSSFVTFFHVFMCFRLFEERARELEEAKEELQERIKELEEEMDHLRRQQLMEGEVKGKLREETSRLTAENMVRLCVRGESECIRAPTTSRNIIFLLQDFEEQLDQKDRLIKKLQSQIKCLEISSKGSAAVSTINVKS